MQNAKYQGAVYGARLAARLCMRILDQSHAAKYASGPGTIAWSGRSWKSGYGHLFRVALIAPWIFGLVFSRNDWQIGIVVMRQLTTPTTPWSGISIHQFIHNSKYGVLAAATRLRIRSKPCIGAAISWVRCCIFDTSISIFQTHIKRLESG